MFEVLENRPDVIHIFRSEHFETGKIWKSKSSKHHVGKLTLLSFNVVTESGKWVIFAT